VRKPSPPPLPYLSMGPVTNSVVDPDLLHPDPAFQVDPDPVPDPGF
jgi:hypothetical protein